MLHDKIIELIEEQNKLGGIDISKLKEGTRLVVQTVNSRYNIVKMERRKILVQGGKYFPSVSECYFNGSTFGGTMLKLDWIGYKMHMEFIDKKGPIKSSPVLKATIHGEGWSYKLDWFSLDSPS